MKFLLSITHNDALELPTDVKVVECRIIDTDEKTMFELKKKFDRAFNKDIENDEFL